MLFAFLFDNSFQLNFFLKIITSNQITLNNELILKQKITSISSLIKAVHGPLNDVDRVRIFYILIKVFDKESVPYYSKLMTMVMIHEANFEGN